MMEVIEGLEILKICRTLNGFLYAGVLKGNFTLQRKANIGVCFFLEWLINFVNFLVYCCGNVAMVWFCSGVKR